MAIPWTILGALLIIWNLVLNIYFNQGWAGANAFLIFNTVYAVFLYIVTILTTWEIDIVLHYIRWLRLFSVIAAIIYTIGWVAGLFQLLFIMEDWDGGKATAMDMYAMMILSYNLIMHVGILPFNFVLIAKEIQIEFY